MPYLGLVMLVLWIFCVVDVLTTTDGTTRNLPKIAWVFIVILLSTIGSLLWLALGRPWPNMSAPNRMVPPTNGYPEYERLGRATGTNAASDDEFLRQCRERAEQQRRQYEEKLRKEQDGAA